MNARLKHFFHQSISRLPARRSGHFLAAWLRAPLKMGSVVPSSRALAHAMAQAVDMSVAGQVIELGAGTGAITHGLLTLHHDKGIARRLVLVEREPRLFALLQQRYPDIRIIRADAVDLRMILSETAIDSQPVAAIVSSLPLLSLPKKTGDEIIKQIALLLSPDAVLVQFTYGIKSPITIDQQRRYRLYGRCIKRVVGNIPPAYVWMYRRERRKTSRA